VIQARSFFPTVRASLLAAAAFTASAYAQQPTIPVPAPTTTTGDAGQGTTTTTTTSVDPKTGKTSETVSATHVFNRGKKKDEKVVSSKATKKNFRNEKKNDALIGVDVKLPDKQLYDKAMIATKKGHFDVARLDLQTMLNTYPDSQYQMRAKLAIADSWYKEGGTAALTQAEQEYRDFCVFFPNVPEAAEAQMRIGDIYFKQMDKPDRDYAKALHAEEEYRRMITDYPDSKLLPEAKQRLREVQEVLATRESDIGAYYATRENWAAVIARYQTVIDTYPLYSHIDDTYVGLGDAYEAQARYVRGLKIAEGPKAKLERLYDDRAAAAYREVVLNHAAAPHVEDAKDRLAAMNLPVPTPTPEELAASEALENSRRSYSMTDKAMLFILHRPDTVLTAQTGEPAMTDPKPTVAPTIINQVTEDFKGAFSNTNAPVDHAPIGAPGSPDATSTATPAPVPGAAPANAAPLAFQPVGDTSGNSGSGEVTPGAAAGTSGSGAHIGGVEVLTGTPNATPASVPNPSVETTLRNAATPADAPAANGVADPNYGLKAVGNTTTALPAIEKPAEAPSTLNTITGATPAAQAAPANRKKAKPAPDFDKSEESSSKHKKKKGLKKIVPPNPF
jgi:outer membrane protein assembly factor BamD